LAAQGRLLQLLARGRRAAVIGETGPGCGVGVAWLLSGADAKTRIVSVERDPQRAEKAAQLFARYPNVTIVNGDWSAILTHGPFDLLVLDGGGTGKTDGDTAVDPNVALKSFGTIVIDDFTPLTRWPPLQEAQLDQARLHWLEHPALLTSELVVCPEMSIIVCTLKG
jgi:predicted O-methyltransferase YrrM